MPRKQLYPQKRSYTPEIDDFIPKSKKMKLFSFFDYDDDESSSLDQCVPDACLASISDNRTKVLNSTMTIEIDESSDTELELSISFNTMHDSTLISDKSIENNSEFVPLFVSTPKKLNR